MLEEIQRLLPVDPRELYFYPEKKTPNDRAVSRFANRLLLDQRRSCKMNMVILAQTLYVRQ